MLDIIAGIFSVIGTLLLTTEKYDKKKYIFWLYLIADVLFLIYGFLVHSIGLIFMYIVYIAIAIKGLINVYHR